MCVLNRGVWKWLGTVLFLCTSKVAWGGDCEVLQQIPPGSHEVGSSELNNPRDAVSGLIARVTATGQDIVVVVDRPSQGGLLTLVPKVKGSYSPLCTTLNVPNGKSIYRVGSFSSTVNVELSGSPGAKAKFAVYTSGRLPSAPDRPAIPLRVRVPVGVYVFSNSPIADINAHTTAANEIWAQAGVMLAFKVRRFDAEKTKEILGADMTILTYLGCSQRFNEPGYKQREALSTLKSAPAAVGVFFAPNKTQSQAEQEFEQVYMSNDPFGSPIGRTLAHEIGHLLLGEGHPGGKKGAGPCTRARADDAADVKVPVTTTSGLMKPANTSSSTAVDSVDGVSARQKAISLPGATWW